VKCHPCGGDASGFDVDNYPVNGRLHKSVYIVCLWLRPPYRFTLLADSSTAARFGIEFIHGSTREIHGGNSLK